MSVSGGSDTSNQSVSDCRRATGNELAKFRTKTFSVRFDTLGMSPLSHRSNNLHGLIWTMPEATITIHGCDRVIPSDPTINWIWPKLNCLKRLPRSCKLTTPIIRKTWSSTASKKAAMLRYDSLWTKYLLQGIWFVQGASCCIVLIAVATSTEYRHLDPIRGMLIAHWQRWSATPNYRNGHGYEIQFAPFK